MMSWIYSRGRDSNLEMAGRDRKCMNLCEMLIARERSVLCEKGFML